MITFAMSGEVLSKILGDKKTECYCCGNKEGKLKQCKVCCLTFCEECMSNEDLCHDCMYELQEEGEFTTYVDRKLEKELFKKYGSD